MLHVTFFRFETAKIINSTDSRHDHNTVVWSFVMSLELSCNLKPSAVWKDFPSADFFCLFYGKVVFLRFNKKYIKNVWKIQQKNIFVCEFGRCGIFLFSNVGLLCLSYRGRHYTTYYQVFWRIINITVDVPFSACSFNSFHYTLY